MDGILSFGEAGRWIPFSLEQEEKINYTHFEGRGGIIFLELGGEEGAVLPSSGERMG